MVTGNHTSQDEDGSIVLSLLAVLVVGALLLVVAATVIAGQTQTRFDRRFEQALQVAEVGLAQMSSLIQSSPTEASFAPLSGSTPDGGTYTVSASKVGSTWTITSSGSTPDGPTRTVEAQARIRPLFNVAAFGRTSVDFMGGNGADSFDSVMGTNICKNGSMSDYVFPGTPTHADTSQTDVNMCDPRGGGAVGTNGELFLRGGVAQRIDRADIYYAKEGIDDPLPDSTGRCLGESDTCALFTPPPTKGKYHREPIEFPAVTVCNFANAAVSFGGDDYPLLANRAYNFSDVTLGGATQIQGTATSPTILCVSGDLTVKQQELINFEDIGGRWVPRRPGSLLIFMTGVGGQTVKMGNNASLSAAVYAPNSAVECGAQGNVYGSLIANSIVNNGGWNFHYDESLEAQMMNAPVRIENWREVR